MNLEWLWPIIAGGAIALLSSLLTGWVQARRDSKRFDREREAERERFERERDAERERFERERQAQVTDQRAELGKGTAMKVLDLLIAIEHDVIRRQYPSEESRFAYDLVDVRDAIARGRTDSKLITDPQVRQLAYDGLNSLPAVPTVDHEFKDLPHLIQRSIVINLEEVVSAFLRSDPLPPRAVAFLDATSKTVQDGLRAMYADEEAEEPERPSDDG